jgi:hypothetical protein
MCFPHGQQNRQMGTCSTGPAGCPPMPGAVDTWAVPILPGIRQLRHRSHLPELASPGCLLLCSAAPLARSHALLVDTVAQPQKNKPAICLTKHLCLMLPARREPR